MIHLVSFLYIFNYFFLFNHLINTVDLCYPQVCLCEFVCLLKLICNSQINTCSTFPVIFGHAQSNEKLSHPACAFPAEVTQSDILPSCFSSHIVKCTFPRLCNAICSYFYAFYWCFCCLKYTHSPPPCVLLKCYLVLARRLRCCREKKLC